MVLRLHLLSCGKTYTSGNLDPTVNSKTFFNYSSINETMNM